MTENERYAEAFVVARTSLEHQVINELMMLGERYVQQYRELSEDEFSELLRQYDEGELQSVVERPTRSNRGTVRLVRRGLLADPETTPPDQQYAVPLLYFVASDYNPIEGHPTRLEQVVQGTPRFGDEGQLAERHRDTSAHRWHLGWRHGTGTPT